MQHIKKKLIMISSNYFNNFVVYCTGPYIFTCICNKPNGIFDNTVRLIKYLNFEREKIRDWCSNNEQISVWDIRLNFFTLPLRLQNRLSHRKWRQAANTKDSIVSPFDTVQFPAAISYEPFSKLLKKIST